MAELDQSSFDKKISEGLRFFEDELSGVSNQDRLKYCEYYALIPEYITNLLTHAMRLGLIVHDTYIIRLGLIRRNSPSLNDKEMYPCSSQESFDEFVTKSLKTLEEWVRSDIVYTKLSKVPREKIYTDTNMRYVLSKGLVTISRTCRLANYLELSINPEYYSRVDAISELLCDE